MKVCEYCGEPFQPKQNHPKYKFCSLECKTKYHKSKLIYKQARCAYMKQHREQNIDKYKQRDADYYIKNKAKFLANNSRRRLIIKQATPKWADLDLIVDVYKEAQYFGFHVDHIIPLRGKTVCGLHVWENLQILPPRVNLQKGNRIAIHAEW